MTVVPLPLIKPCRRFSRTRLSGFVHQSAFSSWLDATLSKAEMDTTHNPRNSSSAERSERIRGLYANANTHLPGEWCLTQNFLSFGIFRFFRPSNCRFKVQTLQLLILSCC